MNGPSGLDTASIIDQLVNLETSTRVTPIQRQKATFQIKIDAYSKMQSYINDIGSKASAISDEAAFNVYKTTTTNKDVATLTGTTGSVAGAYDVKVFGLATYEKLISLDGKITDQNAALSTLGISTGAITIDGTSLTVTNTDTLQDLRSKINSATDATGKKLNVTATVLKVADNNYRLVLTAKNTGNAGVVYKGDTFASLGVIADSITGDKGSKSQIVTSAADISSAFNALVTGDVITYGGTDSFGNAVTGRYVIPATKDINELRKNIENAFHGSMTTSIDVSGKLLLTANNQGDSAASMTSFSMGATPYAFSTTQAGSPGAGILTTGKDAYFGIDGISMRSTTNSATGFVAGVTLSMVKVSATESIHLEIARDGDAVVAKVQSLLDSFNALVRFGKEQTAYGDPKLKTRKKGDLAGDMTITSAIGQFRTLFQKQFGAFGGNFQNLANIGLKTDYSTAEISIDKDKLKASLDTNFDEVVRMFVTRGVTDNTSVAMGRSTKDTTSGKYSLEEISSNTQIRAQLIGGDGTWFTSDVRDNDIVSFSSGPLKGLSLTAPANSIPALTPTTFTFQKGLSATFKELADGLTTTQTGLIATRQASFQRSMDDADKRIADQQNRIAEYKLRLTNQFSAMEQAIQKMKSQSVNMTNQIKSN